MRLRTSMLAALVVLAASARAAADDGASAAAIFDEAREAFDRKDYAEAARKFEEANLRAPRGQTAFNAGIAWEAAGEPTRAADAFALALEDAALPASAATHARARLAAIGRTVMTLHVESADPARASVAGVEGRRLPVTLHLRPGQHDLVVRFDDGRAVRQQIEARAGERVSLRVARPIDDQKAPPKAGAPPPPAPPPAAERPDGGSTQRTIAWIAFGASAVALGTGIYLGVRGVDARDTFDASQQTDAGARSSAVSLRTWANVSFAASAALAGAGAVLMVTAPRAAASRGGRTIVVVGVGSVSGTF